jgi:cell division transport system permease protein
VKSLIVLKKGIDLLSYFYTNLCSRPMSSSFEKYQKRRLISSYFSVVISIALVLFLLGTLGLLVLNTKKIADHFKEQIALTIYLKDTAKEVEINQLNKSLALAEYTKSTTYVTKEEAAEAHSKEIGEDFMEFLGYNPLQNSIDVYFKADYITSGEIDTIAEELIAKSFVDEVVYDKPLISLLNENVTKISFWILAISAVFTFIAVLLINSSIRLSVYSKRFIIKTMQMVGATKRFIRKPFIWKSVKLGMIGAILALIGMAIVLYYMNKSFPELELLNDVSLLAGLFIGVFLMGIIITWLSTFFATQRFLNLKTDELYY